MNNHSDIGNIELRTPWLGSYGDIPAALEYPDCSMADLIFKTASEIPENDAYIFEGCARTFKEFSDDIKLCARGLTAGGIKKGDRVTICMPNVPQAVTMFYALNHIGAAANMVHPLSASMELIKYINDSRSAAVFTLDQFGDKLLQILPETDAKTLILSGVDDGLSGIKKSLYNLTKGRKIPRRATGGNILRYTDLLIRGRAFYANVSAGTKGNDTAAILYSGGTSGKVKGILLTNLNINALALQTLAFADCLEKNTRMLALMPIFHGFGLAVCIHTTLTYGACAVLVPQFSVKTYAKTLKKTKPNYIAGVPTLFEGMLRMKDIANLNMSQMHGVFCGGDSLTVELKRKVDDFLKQHGCNEQIREGYGLTETVTVSCLTPRSLHKEGSIGIPYPDMYYKIVEPDTWEEMPYGEEGEIVISGPTVMAGYDGNEEETKKTLRTHTDGRVWVHTGDLGIMDKDGFIYFRQRMKRMIISSGYSIYPTQLENAIESHEDVLISCVIGVPDEYRKQRVKAFIVLKDNKEPTEAIKESILEHCKNNIAKHAMPREFEYRKDLPRTLVGKVAYTQLEKEELSRNCSAMSPEAEQGCGATEP